MCSRKKPTILAVWMQGQNEIVFAIHREGDLDICE